MNIKRNIFIIIGLLFLANIFSWIVVFSGDNNKDSLYFLNVGQGDSELVRVGQSLFLIDAGKDSEVVKNLEEILPFSKRKIDVVFASHGQQDHMGGLFEVVNRYDVGVVLYNGENSSLWDEFKRLLNEREIPYFNVANGDIISYKNTQFSVLWPLVEKTSNTSNDNSMVILMNSSSTRALFTADISSKTEKILSNFDLNKIDILKIAHHGSKYSSSKEFLDAIKPKVAVVEVGKNSYGHPAEEILDRFKNIGSKVFRTDLDGMIKIDYLNDKIRIFSQN